jgi:serine/threonine protein kinase
MPIDIIIPGYSLKEKIGSGGMADVYLAIQESLGRDVAVKILHQSLSDSGEEFRTRFLHEGQMLAQLIHTNIVPIYDIGHTDEVIYMAMEYLRGGTLTQKMKSGQLVVGDVIKICAQIALALHAAHMQKIIHRDLKPSNIMFRNEVTPVLTDFGIARRIDAGQTLTRTGMMIGTPQYMSPEQIMGTDVDARSDIYALGLMLFRMLTGELPFKATEPMALAMHQVNTPPPPLPDELAELQPVMDLMLAKKPEDRYQNCVDFCNHLQNLSLTNEEYATELSSQTRIFDSSQLRSPSISLSRERDTAETDTSTWTSGAISSIVGTTTRQKRARIGILSVILAISIGLYVVFMPSHDLTPAEERRVNNMLDRYENFVITNNLYEPPGANAAETLRDILDKFPDYEPAQEAADRLAEYYWTDAMDQMEDNNLEAALIYVEDGLSFSAENQQLLDMKQDISQTIAERERRRQIESLLAQAATAQRTGVLAPPEPDNAYKAYKDVLALDELNETALAGLSEIQKSLVARARTAWTNGDPQTAKIQLQETDVLFPDSALVAGLRQEIAEAERLAGEQQEVQQLLTLASRQYEAGKRVQPPGDNALESYERVLVIRPGNQIAEQGRQQIADDYLATARALLEEGDFQSSLLAVTDGLKAAPQNAELLSVQDQATGRLDEKSRAIQERLQRADRLANAGRFIPGFAPADGTAGFVPLTDTGNAFEVYQSMEEIDPGNQQAQQGLAGLPDRVYAAAQLLRRDNDFAQSKALLQVALGFFPGEARYSGLIRTLDGQIAELEASQRLQDHLESLDSMIAQRPVSAELIDRFDLSLQETIRQFPNEVTTSEKLSSFISAITAQAGQSSSGNEYDEALVLLDHALRIYPGNDRLLQSRSSVEQGQSDWIAAISGTLAIDAAPWGRVTEIRGPDNQVVELPANTATPFTMTLPQGPYSITVAGGDAGSLVELSAAVIPQHTVVRRADLNLMTSQAYFERSGWHTHGDEN